MTIRQESKYLTHWNYFLALERDLGVLSRFVEFSRDNWNTHSIEMARIILASASEVDVLLKALCKRLSPKSNADNINKYRAVIRKELPSIPKFRVMLPRYGLNLTPWSNWNSSKVPDWWTAYNKVKHRRDAEFRRANLHNTLNAAAALYVVNLYFYPEQAENAALIPMPSLFRPSRDHFNGVTMNDVEFGIAYKL